MESLKGTSEDSGGQLRLSYFTLKHKASVLCDAVLEFIKHDVCHFSKILKTKNGRQRKQEVRICAGGNLKEVKKRKMIGRRMCVCVRKYLSYRISSEKGIFSQHLEGNKREQQTGNLRYYNFIKKVTLNNFVAVWNKTGKGRFV